LLSVCLRGLSNAVLKTFTMKQKIWDDSERVVSDT
jgi:hypothetical protein